MSVPYDLFIDAFLHKISEFDFAYLRDADRVETTDGYLKRAVSRSVFKKGCNYKLVPNRGSTLREFDVDIGEDDLDEVVDIVSEGMIVQWLKPYVYNQELLQNVMNTRDFSQYSPAELLLRVGNAYAEAQKNYIQLIREYSYDHGDLSDLHI